jgi:hypothetical protein
MGEAAPLAGFIGEIIRVRHIVCMPAKSANPDTGKDEYFIRTTLVGPDGETFTCGSFGVINSLTKLVGVFGPPPWFPYVSCRIKQGITANKQRYFYLELVPDETPDLTAGPEAA